MDHSIEFADPGKLEGEPDDVRRAALIQLDLALQTLDDLLADTEVQVRNAFMSDILGRRGRPTADADDRNLVEQWEDSPGGRWFAETRQQIDDLRATLQTIRDLYN